MKKIFDFQMFEEQTLDIPGIDEDILKELAAELPAPEGNEPAAAEEEKPAEEESTDETDTSSAEQTAEEQAAEEDEAAAEHETEDDSAEAADADSDNKQVSGNNQTNVPYARFKEANERRKAAEKELAELKARLQQPAQQQQQIAAPQADLPDSKSPEQQEMMKAISAEAVRRAKARLGINDEDLSSLEFADNLEARSRFQIIVQEEHNAIMEKAREIARERAAFEQGVSEATQEFTTFVNEFQALPDAADRWDYIANKKFLELPQLQQTVIKAAFERLQNKRGTLQDYFLAKGYFDNASAEYTAQHEKPPAAPAVTAAAPAPKSNTAAKVKAAQALPKAANINGATAKPGMSIEDITNILNEPGAEALDKIPPDILKKILSGQPIG